MNRFDEVMAENWNAEDGVLVFRREPYEAADLFRHTGAGETQRTRAAVAALGKRALAVLIAQEWRCGDAGGTTICGECCADKYQPGEPDDVRRHNPGCEWGAIVAHAKALQSSNPY